MKMKLFILFVLQMFSFCSFAQSSDTEFFKEGKVWRGKWVMYPNSPWQDISVQVYSDTIFNGIKCKKIIWNLCKLNTEEVVHSYHLVGYEKDKKIFMSYTGIGHYDFWEALDFDLPLGYVDEGNVVQKIDTIQVNGIKRKRIKILTNNPEHFSYIVEGIGYSDTAYWAHLHHSFYPVIWEVYEDGKCIFTKDDFKAPPITGIVNVKDYHSSADNAIYNLMGERVDVPVKGQIYIRNHKKFVVK